MRFIVTRVTRSRETLGIITASVSLAVITGATLSPFVFDLHTLTWQAYVHAFGLLPASLFDFPRNVVLFLPLGGAVAVVAHGRGCGWRSAILVATALGAVTSIGVETLQIFLPGRTTNVSDLVGNTLGSLAGAVFIWRTLHPSASTVRSARAWRRAAGVGFGLYLLLMLGLTWGLMRAIRPSGWDAAHRLASGHTYFSVRPWRGRLESVLILDRAVDDADAARLAASEVVPIGLQPAVVPEDPPGDRRCSGCLVAFADGAVESRINKSGEFTVVLAVTPFDVNQPDAGPIIATSPNESAGNLVVKQDQARLVIGWRSLLTGMNDMEPELEFTDVFRSLEPMRIVVSVDGVHARVRTTTAAASLFVSPEAVFSAMLREVNVWSVTPTWLHWWVVAAPLSAFMFIPLGMLLAYAVQGMHQPGYRAAVTALGYVMPALLVEGFVAAYGDVDPRLGILALGIGFSGLGYFVVAAVRPWLRIEGTSDVVLQDAAQAR